MTRTPSFRRSAAYLVMLVALVGPGISRAGQTQPAPTQAQIARGRELCDRADQLRAAGKPAEALKLYQEVLKELPASPRARRGIAACRAALAPKPAAVRSIKGTCEWSGTASTWSATLTAAGSGTYKAVYVSSWGGTPLHYAGVIKSDFKTKISGNGKPTGGGANGTFEFTGTYGRNGVARCRYWEVRGTRHGTLTAERPR